MNSDPPATSSRKRIASDVAPPLDLSTSSYTPPRVLRRQHHRHDNIAAKAWGLEVPVTCKPEIIPSQILPSTSRPAPFNIYKSLLRHPNLFFQFTLRLPLPSAISLYAIDKEFHYLFNKYSASILHDYARYWAPVSSHVFTWVLFPDLCISDPMLKPMNIRTWLARDVPSWRWVRMVLHRQTVVRGILENLTREGCGVLPEKMEQVLCKFWLLIEFPHVHIRQSFLQDKEIWTDDDLRMFHLFMVKLDMRFSHPICSNAPASLSHLFLSQKSLTSLHHLLTTTSKRDFTYDTLAPLVVRTYSMDELDLLAVPFLDDEDVTDVDEEEWGILGKEGWDENGAEMEYAVDMLITEGLSRELHLQRWFLDFVLCGLGNEALVRRWRRRERVEYKGWLGGRERRRVVRKMDERLGLVVREGMGLDGHADEMDFGF